MPPLFKRGQRVGHDGQYVIQQRLGVGNFGETYKAESTNTGVNVALKFFDTNSFKDAQKEARSAARSRHEAIVDVSDVVEWERPFVVMEFIDGEGLSKYIKSNAPLKPSEWWLTLRPLLSGIHHLHAGGLVHLDIKPSNIILRDGKPQQPVIIDFGTAREQDQELSQLFLSPWYSDPEISEIVIERPETSWDIYSLAVISFEALVGRGAISHLKGVREAHEHMRKHLATGTFFFQIIGKGLERMDQRPEKVVDWLLMMAQPNEESDGRL